jgi:hypothetical protein
MFFLLSFEDIINVIISWIFKRIHDHLLHLKNIRLYNIHVCNFKQTFNGSTFITL